MSPFTISRTAVLPVRVRVSPLLSLALLHSFRALLRPFSRASVVSASWVSAGVCRGCNS